MFLLLLTAIPVRATNNSLPEGVSVDLSFSPSKIPLGYSSTLSITVVAQGVGTDIYAVVGIQLEDWLRWQTSDIKLGDFLYGGVVFKSDNQLFNGNFLQIGVVVPKESSRTISIPVTPTRTGIFYLNEVIVVTLPVINGDFVRAQDGWTLLGYTYSTLQFPNHLEVYDPTLRAVSENQRQSLANEQALSAQLSNVTSGLGLLTSLVNVGFQGVNAQHDALFALYERQTESLLYQTQFLIRMVWILVGAIVALGVYLLWFTYRLSKSRT